MLGCECASIVNAACGLRALDGAGGNTTHYWHQMRIGEMPKGDNQKIQRDIDVISGALEQTGAALAQKKETVEKSGGLSTGKLTYTRDVMEEICCGLANGKSLREVCREKGMPGEATVRYWVSKDIDGCALAFQAAREVQAHRLAEEIIALADESPPVLEDGRVDQGWVTWQKMRIDSRKWKASRILPKEYGEHVSLKGDTAAGGLNIRIDLT